MSRGDQIIGVVLLAIIGLFVTPLLFRMLWNNVLVGALTILMPIDYWAAFWMVLALAIWAAPSTL